MLLLWSTLFWAVPPLFLLQIGALLLLLWRVVWRWQPHTLGSGRPGRWLLYVGVFLAPPFMLFMSAAFSGGYQGERGGHWFFHMHSELAGLVLVPAFSLGSLSMAIAVAKGSHLRSGTNYIILITLIAICAWYAFATAFLGMGNDKSEDLSFTAIVPALAGVNYALLGLDIRRHAKLEPPNTVALYVWFAAIVASLAAKIPLARQFYGALPPERPAGYGDCFVVSAAALGHPSLVGSCFDPILKCPVNRQLTTLRGFEKHLASHWPSLHRRLRRGYNWIGPRIAARIRSPFAADIAYLLLKPAEWLAWLYLAVSQRSSLSITQRGN